MSNIDYTKPPRVFSPDKPSEEILEAVDRHFCAGSCRVWCEACGRTVFADDRTYDWETRPEEFACDEWPEKEGEDELDYLLRLSEEQPQWFIRCDHTPGVATVNTKQISTSCECNFLTMVENFWWSHRGIIAGYFARKFKQEAEELAALKKIVEIITGADRDSLAIECFDDDCKRRTKENGCSLKKIKIGAGGLCLSFIQKGGDYNG